MRLKWTLLIYIALLIGAAVLVSRQGGGFTYVLFFSVALYLPISLVQILYTRFALRIYQDVEGRLLYKNTAVPYQLSMSNAGILPMGGITLVRDEGITNYERDVTAGTFGFLPLENKRLDTKISCRYAGGYDAGVRKIKITDAFSMMELTYEIPTPLRVHVLPIVSDLATEDIRRVYEELDNSKNLYRLDSDDITPGNDIRKYMPGDALGTVHWKNFARTGELYVRLPEKQESDLLTIVVLPEDVITLERHDYMLEYIVSAAELFAKQGKPINIIYYCGGVKRELIGNYDSFRTFYMEKLKDFGAVGKQMPPDAKKKLQEAAADAEGAVLLFEEETGTLMPVR